MDVTSYDTEQEQHIILTILLHILLTHFEFWTMSNKFKKLYKVQFLIHLNQHGSWDDWDLMGKKRWTHRPRVKLVEKPEHPENSARDQGHGVIADSWIKEAG